MTDIAPTVTGYPVRCKAISPDNDNDLTDFDGKEMPMQIQSVDGGDVNVRPVGNPTGQTIVFTVAAGDFIPVQVRQVLATSTTSATIRGYW